MNLHIRELQSFIYTLFEENVGYLKSKYTHHKDSLFSEYRNMWRNVIFRA
jgi:hypothetical protein